MSWKDYGDWAFYACAAVTGIFAVMYLVFAPWRDTLTGRNIMAVMGSLAVAFIYFAWIIAIGGVPTGFYPVRALIFTGIALAIGWRLVIFIKHHIIKSLRTPRKGASDELEDTW